MTDPNRAAFLSYASQDARAARRICEALRAAGIEVWFDQSELRGGDAWDQMIRRQIKSCSLFMPIISVNTQSREEGYFRREWNLAVARTLDMAEDRAFLLPIVIDGTSDSEARVPEKFREVQWTRLPVGANTNSFIDQVCRLLSPEPTTPSGTSFGSSAQPKSMTGAASARSRPPTLLSFVSWVVGGLLIIATGYLSADKFLASKHAVPVAETPTAARAPVEAVSDKSIAVLPFADMSEKKDQEYFSDGLAEELIDQLGKVRDLKVIARTSSFSFKGKSDDISAIAEKLKVANVLEGSVRRSGKHLRISAQLVRADNGYHIWSETYDRQVDDIFKVQDEIAGAVVRELKVSLMGHPLATANGTKNIEAYNLYLQARALYLHTSTSAGLQIIFDYTRKSLALDDSYAPAWAFLGRALSYQAGIEIGNGHEGPILEEARHAAARALELDPANADAHAALGRIYKTNLLDLVHAEAELRQALAIDPNNSFALAEMAQLFSQRGQFARALDLNQQSINSDPANPVRYGDQSDIQYFAGRYSDSLSSYRKMLELDPGHPFAHTEIGNILLARGDPAASLTEMDRETDEKTRLCNVGRALAYDALGRKAAADAVLAYAEKNCADHDSYAYDIGTLHATRGEVVQALNWLERAYRRRESSLNYAKVDPFLKNIRSEPRFTALLERMGLAQ